MPISNGGSETTPITTKTQRSAGRRILGSFVILRLVPSCPSFLPESHLFSRLCINHRSTSVFEQKGVRAYDRFMSSGFHGQIILKLRIPSCRSRRATTADTWLQDIVVAMNASIMMQGSNRSTVNHQVGRRSPPSSTYTTMSVISSRQTSAPPHWQGCARSQRGSPAGCSSASSRPRTSCGPSPPPRTSPTAPLVPGEAAKRARPRSPGR